MNEASDQMALLGNQFVILAAEGNDLCARVATTCSCNAVAVQAAAVDDKVRADVASVGFDHLFPTLFPEAPNLRCDPHLTPGLLNQVSILPGHCTITDDSGARHAESGE